MPEESGITGGNELIDALEAKYDLILGRLVEKVNYSNHLLAEKIRSNLSGVVLQARSGKLRDSVKETPVTISNGIVEGGVTAGGPEAPYGGVHEDGGTRNYEIRPVNKQYLAFMVDGKQIFTKLVQRTPALKRPFVAPAKLELEAEIQQALRSAVEG